MNRLLRHPSILITGALMIGYGAFQLWCDAAGAAKVAAVAGATGPDRRVSAEVVLTIAPERFHIELMQDAGRVVEIKGHSIFLADLPVERARAIARNYWVASVRPWRRTAS